MVWSMPFHSYLKPSNTVFGSPCEQGITYGGRGVEELHRQFALAERYCRKAAKHIRKARDLRTKAVPLREKRVQLDSAETSGAEDARQAGCGVHQAAALHALRQEIDALTEQTDGLEKAAHQEQVRGWEHFDLFLRAIRAIAQLSPSLLTTPEAAASEGVKGLGFSAPPVRRDEDGILSAPETLAWLRQLAVQKKLLPPKKHKVRTPQETKWNYSDTDDEVFKHIGEDPFKRLPNRDLIRSFYGELKRFFKNRRAIRPCLDRIRHKYNFPMSNDLRTHKKI